MILISLVFLVAAIGNLDAVEIACEKIAVKGEYENCCFLNAMTVISHKNVTFAGFENAFVFAIFLESNKKIQFLTMKVYKKFPNLRFYFAGFTSVKEISALNFERLSSLEQLDLRGNEIAFIPDFCFEGLSKLNEIDLSERK